MSAAAAEAYLNTRVSVMATQLFDGDTIGRLAQMQLPDLAENFDLALLTDDQHSAQTRSRAIEQSLIGLLLSELQILVRPMNATERALVLAWGRKYALFNLKTLIRGKLHDLDPKEIRDNLFALPPSRPPGRRGPVPGRERARAPAPAGSRTAQPDRPPGARDLRAAARALRAGGGDRPALLRRAGAPGAPVPRFQPSATPAPGGRRARPHQPAYGCCVSASPTSSPRRRPSTSWCPPCACCIATGCSSWSIWRPSRGCWRPSRRPSIPCSPTARR